MLAQRACAWSRSNLVVLHSRRMQRRWLHHHHHPAEHKVFRLPADFVFQCDMSSSSAAAPRTVPAEIAYQTYGTLNEDRSNVILYPTSYGATHVDIEWLIQSSSSSSSSSSSATGDGGILDPSKYFIVIPNMFGNGMSFSPSTNLEFWTRRRFYTTHYDNVRAQKLLLQSLGILRDDEPRDAPPLQLVYGWSMGAQQAYHWAAMYPKDVRRIAALCGTARTTDHNRIFLWSLRAALQADPTFDCGKFHGTPHRGYRAFTHIYASWAASQDFYNQTDKPWKEWGFETLQDYVDSWEVGYRQRDPHDLLAMIETWLRCDVSDNPLFKGDYRAAMASMRHTKVLVMPSTTDLYFTPASCRAEATLIQQEQQQQQETSGGASCTYLPIPSIWGHRAGNPKQNAADAAFIKDAVANLLADDD